LKSCSAEKLEIGVCTAVFGNSWALAFDMSGDRGSVGILTWGKKPVFALMPTFCRQIFRSQFHSSGHCTGKPPAELAWFFSSFDVASPFD
jgi:hypothetical protein